MLFKVWFVHNLISFLVLAFFDSSLLRSHFWPLTDVQPEIRREVTRKGAEIFGTHELPTFAPQSRDYGGQAADVTERVICRTRMRSGFYENERSFRLAAESCTLAACAPQTRTLLRRERSDDFFEARIAAQRVPIWIEAKVTVMCTRRDFGESLELLNGQVALAGPRTDHSIRIKYVRAVECILRQGEKVHRPATLAQRLFFSPECSVDQAQDAKSRAIVGPRANRFLLLRTRGTKGGACRDGVSFHPSNQTLHVIPAKFNHTSCSTNGIILSERCEGTISSDRIALPQSKIKALAHQVSRPYCVILENHFESSVYRSGIGSLPYVNPTTSQPVTNVVWFEGDEAINSLSGLFVLAQAYIGRCGTNEDPYVSRIQLTCMLEVARGIVPTALPAVDVPTPFKNSCVVRQGANGDGELVKGVVVIEVAVVKVRSQGKVRLA